MPLLCMCRSLFAFVVAAGASEAPSCLDDSGHRADFAYAFKYPGGWDYAYMDAHNKLAKSPQQLNSTSSSISKTILQLGSEGVSFAMWNDEPPVGYATEAPNAHSKGLLAFTSSGGFWLTHSLPKFPSKSLSTGPGLWTAASDDNGQSFLCITLSREEIRKLSPVFRINRVSVYNSKFVGDETSLADVQAWAVEHDWDKATMTTRVRIQSKGGQAFTVYGKNPSWGKGKDLYSDLVAPDTGELLMEGWRRGVGAWRPACGKDKVLDVMSVSLPGMDWNVMEDHSKWAVAQSGTAFCVGDINRMKGQDMRGGGTVCIRDASFAGQMRKVIDSTDKCSGDLVVV